MSDTAWQTYEKRGVVNRAADKTRCEKEAYLALVEALQAPAYVTYTWRTSETFGRLDLTARGRVLTLEEMHQCIRRTSNDH